MKKKEKQVNGLIEDKYELIAKEFQTFLSVFYLLLVGIGMLFSYEKYSRFGINIFQYSDIFDFLLTPFRDLYIFIFSLASIAIVFFVYTINKLIKNKFPKYYNSKYRLGLLKSHPLFWFIMIFIIYLFLFSIKYGKFTERKILENPKFAEIILSSGNIKKGNLIGKNNGYIFMLENNNEIKIYPISNVVEINKKLYLKKGTNEKSENYEKTKKMFKNTLN